MLFLALGWMVLLYWLRKRQSAERPRWGLLAALVLLTSVATFVIYAFPIRGFVNAFPIDDSYITLTAARNLAQHGNFAINPRYPLAGITSPLHVAVTGFVGLFMPVEIASRVVGLLFLLALGLGVLYWGKELAASPSVAAAAAAITIICGPMGFGALNGLETVPFTALLIWSCVAYEIAWRRTPYWLLMGALVGLTILTRPEGWFLAAALYLVAGWRLWKEKPLREWRRAGCILLSGGLALAVIAPYLAANYHYYHELFPSTVSAKSNFFANMCVPLTMRIPLGISSSWLSLGPYVVLLPLLYWARPYLRRIYPWLFVLFFYASYYLLFVGGLSHYWGRYQHPLLPVLLLGIVMGADTAHRTLTRGGGWVPKVVGVGLALFLFVGAGLGGQLEKDMYRNALVNSQSFLMSITDFIQANTQPGETVATHDVGALYYFGGRPVLDLVGLADPQVAKMYAGLHGRCARNERRTALYRLVKNRAPRLVYFSPKWDQDYLGLVRTDLGRHMKKVWHLSHDYQINDKNDVKVYEYDFYRCDWEHDLRTATP